MAKLFSFEAKKETFLYHYSAAKFDSIMSKVKQGGLTSDDLKEEERIAKFRGGLNRYSDGCYLLFDPAPLDIIGDLFAGRNATWLNGKRLWEYKVSLDDIQDDIVYDVFESPAATKFMDEVEWVEDDKFKKDYFRRKAALKHKLEETGKGKEKLTKQIQLFQGTTRDMYIAASKRADFDENSTKYAACVPHVGLYPSTGELKVASRRLVVVGHKQH